MKYTHRVREEGGSGSPPTIHLRTDDVREGQHSFPPLSREMSNDWEGGGGGGAMAVSRGRGVIFVLKFKNCI